MKENPQLQASLRGLVYLPIESAKNQDFCKSEGVHSFPTFSVWDATGGLLDSWIGYSGPEEFGPKLSGFLEDPVTLAEREGRFKAGPSVRDAMALGSTAYARNQLVEADGYFRRAMDIDRPAALAEDARIWSFRARFYGIPEKIFTVADVQAAAGEILSAPDVKPDEVFEVTRRLIRAIDTAGEDAVVPYLRIAYPLVVGIQGEKYSANRKEFLCSYALLVEKDLPKAATLKRETLPAGWDKDPAELNNFAWWCFEHKVNLEEAEALARHAVDLSPVGPDQANLLDTLAEIVNARGAPGEARELIRRALELNPEDDYLKGQLEKFGKAAPSGAPSV